MIGSFLDRIAALLREIKLWQTVPPWELGVRVRFGKRVSVLQPGIHWKIPLLDKINCINVRLRVASVPTITVSTLDGRAVTVSGNVGFCISDPLLAAMRFSMPEDVCAAYAQGALSEVVSKGNWSDLNQEDVSRDVMKQLQAKFDGNGMRIDFFNATEFVCVRTLRLLQESWRPSTGHMPIFVPSEGPR